MKMRNREGLGRESARNSEKLGGQWIFIVAVARYRLYYSLCPFIPRPD